MVPIGQHHGLRAVGHGRPIEDDQEARLRSTCSGEQAGNQSRHARSEPLEQPGQCHGTVTLEAAGRLTGGGPQLPGVLDVNVHADYGWGGATGPITHPIVTEDDGILAEGRSQGTIRPPPIRKNCSPTAAASSP